VLFEVSIRAVVVCREIPWPFAILPGWEHNQKLMAVPKDTLWSLEPHTQAKHDILRRYLSAWFPILSRGHDKIAYLDGFSGPGRYTGGEPGSPLIALDVAINHRWTFEGEIAFWFMEERPDRLEHLRKELGALAIPGHIKIHTECNEFAVNLKKALDTMDQNGLRMAPTFALVDPFGFSGIPYTLIERLLSQRKCEALITFMVDAINRFLEHPDELIVRHIVDAFGTDEALKVAKSPGDRIEHLRCLYQSQLRRVASFVRYFEMRDKQGRIQYYLFFATNNPLGHLKMKEAMWAVDPLGEFRFSDATNPSQTVLFNEPNIGELASSVRGRFAGRGTIPAATVRLFVEDETAYLKKHMTSALQDLEQGGGLSVQATKSDGTKRKAKSYPDNALLSFH
jgi:three-Cys-motif partner protein